MWLFFLNFLLTNEFGNVFDHYLRLEFSHPVGRQKFRGKRKEKLQNPM